MNKIQKISLGAMVALSVLMPVLAFALPVPTPPIASSPVTLAEIEERIRQVAQFLIIVGVILAVIFIIWGGLAYMFARGDDTKVKEARKRIWSGVIGAVIVLAVGVILQTLAALVTRTFFG